MDMSYSQHFPGYSMDMGSFLRTMSGVIDNYVHPEWSLGEAIVDSSSCMGSPFS